MRGASEREGQAEEEDDEEGEGEHTSSSMTVMRLSSSVRSTEGHRGRQRGGEREEREERGGRREGGERQREQNNRPGRQDFDEGGSGAETGTREQERRLAAHRESVCVVEREKRTNKQVRASSLPS